MDEVILRVLLMLMVIALMLGWFLIAAEIWPWELDA